MNRRIIQIGIFFLIMMGLITSSQAAGTQHVNIAAFHKLKANYDFEAIVMGRFSDFIATMEKGSEIIFLNHTSDVQNHDVITFNADVLREAEGQGFDDNGVNCSISFTDASDAENTAYSIGGLCTMLLSKAGKHEKFRFIIPEADLPDTSQGIDVWVMIYEDEKTGIAFYANVSSY